MTKRQGAIVLVDDDADVLNVVQEVLSISGFTVHRANNAATALDLLCCHPTVDLLLTDINMPEIDGYMLADMVKTHCPTMRVLYMTGRNLQPPREQGVCHGPTIVKPFRRGELVAAVEGCLRAPPKVMERAMRH